MAPLQSTYGQTRFYFAFAALCTCNFVSVLDSVIIAPALPSISKELKAGTTIAFWCGIGFLLAQAVSQPIIAALSERFGRLVCLLSSMLVFTIASALCATAQNTRWLITARVIQGLGAGGSNGLVSMVIADLTTLNNRSKYYAILSVWSTVASICGPIIGGTLAERVTWRWIFYINLPICTLIMLVLSASLKLPRREKTSLGQFDWVGAIIFAISVTAFLFGITAANTVAPWKSPAIIVPIVTGVAGVIIFVLFEIKFARPMLQMRIFKNRTAASALLTSFLHGLVLWAAMYYLILYFLLSKRKSVLAATIALTPGAAVAPAAALITGLIIAKISRFKLVNILSWCFLLLGFSLSTTVFRDTRMAFIYVYQVLYAIGAGALYIGRILAMQASQETADVPMATSMISFFASVGQAFGVAIGSALYNHGWQSGLTKAIDTDQLPAQYILPVTYLEQVSSVLGDLPKDVQAVYGTIAATANRELFIALAACSGLGLVIALFSQNLRLEKSEEAESEEALQELESSQDAESTEVVINSKRTVP